MPEMFGKYQLLEKIGEGGMAEVWKARSTGAAGFQKILVVKKILPMYARNKAFVDMLITEAKLCSVLQHPNIIPIFDLGEIDGAYYITMEYVDGVDLLHILQRAARKQAKVPVEVALFIAGEVARGLAYAHGAVDHEGRPLNIIHRDVSPANVMVSTRGEVKLMDFGVARADLELEQRRSAATLVRHDGLKGKLSYMSPELVTGEEYDHRSDIFALGTLLFEMLTLKRLFMGKSELQTLANVRKARITRRIERHDYLPEPVTDIIRRALARVAEDRYPSAQDFYDDVQDFLYEARLRVDPSVVARFIVTLFPERTPRAAPPRVTAPKRLRAAVEPEDEPAAPDGEDVRTVRTGRPRVIEDTLEQELPDEDEGNLGPHADRPRPPVRSARHVAAASSSPDGELAASDGDPEAALADASRDPIDELIAALASPAPPNLDDPGADDYDEDDGFVVEPVPPNAQVRVKGDNSDLDSFGPVTLTNLRRLVASRAISEREHVSVDGGAWVRMANTELKRSSPDLFERPGALVHVGPLRQAWLPRLFHRLSAVAATGLLELSRGWRRKELHYRDGALLHIQSNIKSELLAHVALDLGVVSEEQVAAALEQCGLLGLPVGEGLIEVGALDEAQLQVVLREQQRRRFLEIFSWPEGRFAFYDDTLSPQLVRPEPLAVLAMFGPAVRTHYDLATLRAIFRPHLERAIIRPNQPRVPPAALGLTADEAAALERLAPLTTVARAVADNPGVVGEGHVLRALFLMLQLDLMHFATD